MLFFPLELVKRRLYIPQYPILEELLVNYYSAILLADDLLDLDDDINHKCLTYPIIRYFKIKKELPMRQEDVMPMMPRFARTFQRFVSNIENLGVGSLVIKDTLADLRNNLSSRGIEI